MLRLLMATLLLLMSPFINAEIVTPKYRGPVDLDQYSCTWVSRSSFIGRVCYSRSNTSMVILLGPTYYEYCRVPPQVVDALLTAPSMGRFYNQGIKSRYDCRL